MGFQNIVDFKIKLNELYQIALLNKWNYLPLFEEL